MSRCCRTGRVSCPSLRFLCGLDEGDAAEAQIRAGEFRIVDGNGEDVLAGGESDGDGEAVNDAVVVGRLGGCGRKEIGLGAGGEVVAQDFDTVEIDDDGVVTLAAQLKTGVGFVRGESVAEIRAVAMGLIGRPSLQASYRKGLILVACNG